MAIKILVADDSSTIQKVVRITLAQTGYELVEALTEDELFNQLKTNSFDLVLIDFNLSDDKSGYQLCSEIASFTSSKILALLGAFDSINEQELHESGVTDKIVKPFDSANFIAKCKNLIENSDDSNSTDNNENGDEESQDEEIIFSQESNENDLNSWTMDAPQQSSVPPMETLEERPDDMPEEVSAPDLNQQVSDWGMEIPAKLDDSVSDDHELLPPIIDDSEFTLVDETNESNSIDDEDDKEEEVPFIEPSQDDLEYPDFMDSDSFTSVDDEDTPEITFGASSDDEGPSSLSIDVPEEVNLSLEHEINKEQSPDDFWKTDNFIDPSAESISIPSANINEIENQVQSIIDPVIDYDLLTDKIKEAILPKLEQIMREECQKMIKEVAWETIPDLAENLIKKELKELRESIEKK